jgi:hypothetical protein
MTAKESVQRTLVHAFLGLAALQFFLAGLGVFRNNPDPGKKIIESSTFDPHRIVGDIASLVAILILVMALITRRQIQLASALFVLMIIQNLLAGLGEDTPVFGALHALNGVLLLAIGTILLLRLRPADRARAPAA